MNSAPSAKTTKGSIWINWKILSVTCALDTGHMKLILELKRQKNYLAVMHKFTGFLFVRSVHLSSLDTLNTMIPSEEKLAFFACRSAQLDDLVEFNRKESSEIVGNYFFRSQSFTPLSMCNG